MSTSNGLDLALYLVTDSSPHLLKGRGLVDVVEAAIRGGVTVVQLREKTAETADIVKLGKRLHAVTQKYGIPLLVNDRVDVAVAIGAEGVHLGQDDLDYGTARRILGKDAIIGATVSSLEVAAAVDPGVNYLGIGTVYATPTKEDSKAILGTAGVKKILHGLDRQDARFKKVVIGGINASNVRRVYSDTADRNLGIDGVAVVSTIMGADDPEKAAAELVHITKRIQQDFGDHDALSSTMAKVQEELLQRVSSIVQDVVERTPLSHNMTNLVVQNFAANVALAVGGSPIMAGNGAEAPDLAQIAPAALVINMGSCDAGSVQNYVMALKAYNAQNHPVLLDPVGGGAIQLRRQALSALLAAGQFTVIKGNEGEIRAALGPAYSDSTHEQQQRGVDSGPSTRSTEQRARLAEDLAVREEVVVLLTGAVDIVTDGRRTLAIANGHPLLGRITGSGCTLGTTVSCCLAVHAEDPLAATLAGVLLFELAAERAAGMVSVNGPGTFVPAFVDKLAEIAREAVDGNAGWVELAQVTPVTVGR